jgi:hypothetical protein
MTVWIESFLSYPDAIKPSDSPIGIAEYLAYNVLVRGYCQRRKMDQLQIDLKYRWFPVYLREKVDYLFPMAISPHMRLLYKGPAVFKWEVFQKIAGDKEDRLYRGSSGTLS